MSKFPFYFETLKTEILTQRTKLISTATILASAAIIASPFNVASAVSSSSSQAKIRNAPLQLNSTADIAQFSLEPTAQYNYNKLIAIKIEKLKTQQAEADAAAQAVLAEHIRVEAEKEAARVAEIERLAAEQRAIAAAAEAKRIADIKAAEEAERISGKNYPWASAPFPNSAVDSWGMYKRQCVSYAAWKVAVSGRNMPNWGGRGNANNWANNARAAGIPVDRSPRVGDIAVMYIGQYGHVAYVEGVNGDGTIRISQYNYSFDGKYSEMTISTAGLDFIHF